LNVGFLGFCFECGHSGHDSIANIDQSCFLVPMFARTFTNPEREFLEKIAEKLPNDTGERLRADLTVARVIEDGDYLQVELAGYERPDYIGHMNLPFEGKLLDVRGGPVTLLVNIDQNERLLEVEIIWWESESGAPLDWPTLEIIETPP
jgi:hypothetical protein